MSTNVNSPHVRLDQFFTVAEARHDRWRNLLSAARAWGSALEKRGSTVETKRSSVAAIFKDLRQWEDFFAYPGPALLQAIEERMAAGDHAGTARLVQAISVALLTHSYRSNDSAWEGAQIAPGVMSEKLPVAGNENAPPKPYFEVLIATAAPPSTWPGLSRELRKLRRPQDTFIYETVFVSSYEDAILGTILNGSLQAIIISEGIPFASLHNSPVLREFLTGHLAATGMDVNSPDLALSLAQGIKLIRPELDIYLLSDREVEKVAVILKRNACGGFFTRWKSRLNFISVFSMA